MALRRFARDSQTPPSPLTEEPHPTLLDPHSSSVDASVGPGPVAGGTASSLPPDPPAGPQVPVVEPARRGPGRSRISAAWVALAAGMVALVIVLVFILQNLKSVRVHFFWATWSIPLAIDLLLASVLGGLVVFTVGSVRIMQLRRATRRSTTAEGAPR